MRPRRTTLPAALLVLLGGVAACHDVRPSRVAVVTVRIASYDSSESQILAAVYAEGARREGLRVSLRRAAGGLEPVLEQGRVDLVVDSAGTVLELAGATPAAPTRAGLHTALQESFAARGVAVLDVGVAEDRVGFAVSRAFAAAHHVTRLSELAPLAAGLTFGGPSECPAAPQCLPGLVRDYGLRFGSVRRVPPGATTVGALLSGQIQVGLLDSADAWLEAAPVVLLTDDRARQSPQNVVPLVRADVLQHDWGDRLRAVVNTISQRLTTEDLMRLDRAVEIDGLAPAQAAERWWDDGA